MSRQKRVAASFLPDSFTEHRLHHGAGIVGDAPLVISTPAAQWSYALSCRLQPHLVDDHGAVVKTVRFVFDLTVVRGRIGVGWTSPDGNSFLIERLTFQRDCRISFLLQAGAHVGEFVFRNVDASGQPSEFIVAQAGVELVANDEYRYPGGGALVERILELDLWGSRPFFLLDVGCSGGLQPRWFTFGDRLRAVGFDPLLAEIDRLGRLNSHPGVVYEAAFVGCEGYDELFPPQLRNGALAAKSNQSFQRTSAVAAARQMPTTYIQEVFNAGAPVILTERRITLDDYVSAGEHADVDFLKVDTDGHDIEVILGATDILSAGGLLGLQVEVQFHGLPHDHANTFSNIDRLLRGQGFSLFDLELHRYSRADLPAPFASDTPAATMSGQVLWGEALYLRDLASPRYGDAWEYEVTPERVMKLASVFDLYQLPDCAAELLRNRGDHLAPSIRDTLLDLLVSGEPGAHAALVASFERDFTSFYPREWQGTVSRRPVRPAMPSTSPR